MEIRIFNQALEPLGIVDELASTILNTRYFDVGNISILAPATKNNLKLLVNGNIAVIHDGTVAYTDSTGTEWRRAAEFKYIHIEKDEQGEEQIEAQGYSLSNWLNKRMITPQLVCTDTCQNIINAQVKRNCGSSASKKRRFEKFSIIEQDNYGGTKTDYSNEAYIGLGVEVKAVAQNGKLGYDILINEKGRAYGFYLYKGTDRTVGNTAGLKPCIFSSDFDNINSRSYEYSSENYKNFIYIIGKAADDETITPVVAYDGEGVKGIQLEEVAIESDIERTYTDDDNQQQTIALATYKSMLSSQAVTELAGYGANINFDSAINTASNLQYRQDFNIGDRVTCQEKDWGIKLDARITEVSEVWQKGTHTVEVTFGESTPTLIEKIRKVR
jgi:hypothetical protein